VDFFKKQLSPVLAIENIDKIVTFEVIPYGATKQLDKETFQCEQGNSDCVANKVVLCGMSQLQANNKVRFMNCIL
jgi:hypothetical protein